MAEWIKDVEADHQNAPRGPSIGPSWTPSNQGSGKEKRRSMGRFHHEVFTLFRPWQGCARCQSDVKAGTVTPPETGDLLCPHTRHDAYTALVQRLYDQDGAQELHRKLYTNDHGEELASVSWFEVDRQAVRDPEVDNPAPPLKEPTRGPRRY